MRQYSSDLRVLSVSVVKMTFLQQSHFTAFPREGQRGKQTCQVTQKHPCHSMVDAHASIKALQSALVARGHDVIRTPSEWMALDASDETQLLGATAHGRCILTFNARDFVALAGHYPRYGGIILATQTSWSLPGRIAAMDRLLSETQGEDWVGQVRWLNQWRVSEKGSRISPAAR